MENILINGEKTKMKVLIEGEKKKINKRKKEFPHLLKPLEINIQTYFKALYYSFILSSVLLYLK